MPDHDSPLPDPFAALGLPRRFDLDPKAIEAAYLKRTALLHPDRLADPARHDEAARQAAIVNDARAALLDAEQRGNALLTLLGGATREQDTSLPPDFLPSIMQVREELEEALVSDDPAERQRLEQWAQAQREEYRRRVARLFADAGGGANAAPDRLGDIRTTLNAWRYIERMIEQLGNRG